MSPHHDEHASENSDPAFVSFGFRNNLAFFRYVRSQRGKIGVPRVGLRGSVTASKVKDPGGGRAHSGSVGNSSVQPEAPP
jgi:hypothetical protein